MIYLKWGYFVTSFLKTKERDAQFEVIDYGDIKVEVM